jgi:Recombinase
VRGFPSGPLRRVFALFAETGPGTETAKRLQAEGVASKSGRPLDRGDVYKILNLRTYVGEVVHKGQVYPG